MQDGFIRQNKDSFRATGKIIGILYFGLYFFCIFVS